MTPDAAQSTLTDAEKAKLLMQMFVHGDSLQWRMPIYSVSSVALIVGAGAWVLSNFSVLTAVSRDWAQIIFAVLVLLSAFILWVGSNNMHRTYQHLEVINAELRKRAQTDYHEWLHQPRPGYSAAKMARGMLEVAAGVFFLGSVGLLMGSNLVQSLFRQ